MSVRQLRVVVETDNYEQAIHFYCDVLGLPEELALDGDGGARVTILAAGARHPRAGQPGPAQDD